MKYTTTITIIIITKHKQTRKQLLSRK